MSRCHIRNGANLWQIHDFLLDGNSNVFSIFHHLWLYNVDDGNDGTNNTFKFIFNLTDARVDTKLY